MLVFVLLYHSENGALLLDLAGKGSHYFQVAVTFGPLKIVCMIHVIHSPFRQSGHVTQKSSVYVCF